MTTNVKKTIKKIVNILLWVFLVFALAMTVFAFIANSSSKEYPVIGDNCLLCVETDSMDGDKSFYEKNSKSGWDVNYGFKKGSLIIGKVITETQKYKLKVGDVVTFYYQDIDSDGEAELYTHRIIAIEKEEDGLNTKYRTHGDNNPESMYEIITAQKIEAVWVGQSVSGLGSFINFFRSSLGFLLCVVVPLAIFFVYEVVVLIMTIINVKGKKSNSITAEEEELIKKRAVEEYLAKQAIEQANKEEKKE